MGTLFSGVGALSGNIAAVMVLWLSLSRASLA